MVGRNMLEDIVIDVSVVADLEHLLENLDYAGFVFDRRLCRERYLVFEKLAGKGQIKI